MRLPNPYAPPLAEIRHPGEIPLENWVVQSVSVALVLAALLWNPLSFQSLQHRLTLYVMQLLLAIGLAVPLARGVGWVRWIVVVACAAVGLEQVYTGSVLLQILQAAPVTKWSVSSVYWITFGVALLHFSLAALLVLPRSVRDFYASVDRTA